MAAEEREDRDLNRDPITDEPGAHPIGTGIGATGGAVAGAAAGSIAGPIGAAVGGVVGAVVGGLAGHAAGEAVNPTAEEAFWRENYDKEGKFERGENKGKLTRTDRSSWQDKSWIIGIQVGASSKAYDWNRLVEQRIVRRDNYDRRVFVDQGNRAMLQFTRGVALGVDVRDFLKLQRAFQRDRVARATAEIEHISRVLQHLRDGFDFRLGFQRIRDQARRFHQSMRQPRLFL